MPINCHVNYINICNYDLSRDIDTSVDCINVPLEEVEGVFGIWRKKSSKYIWNNAKNISNVKREEI